MHSDIKKINVGVIMGGRNTENEVSFNSGRTICDHLDTSRFNIIPIFQTFIGELYLLPYRFLHRGKISDFEHRLAGEAQRVNWDELKKLIDFAYLATHGRNMEDGALQGMLEVLKIPYLGSKILASAISMDKIIQRQFLQANHINIPKGFALDITQILDLTNQETFILAQIKLHNLEFPVIVKPHKEGSSLGISLAKDYAELALAINKAAYIHPGIVQPVIIEECLKGLEFSCIILEDQNGKPIALPPTEIVIEASSDIFDYTQKYMPGRASKHTPARCTPVDLEKIKQTCIAVKEILQIDTIARIDGFLTQDQQIYIIDPNSLSGMGPTSFIFLQAAEQDISHSTLINHLIDTELKRYQINSILSLAPKVIYHETAN